MSSFNNMTEEERKKRASEPDIIMEGQETGSDQGSDQGSDNEDEEVAPGGASLFYHTPSSWVITEYQSKRAQDIIKDFWAKPDSKINTGKGSRAAKLNQHINNSNREKQVKEDEGEVIWPMFENQRSAA